MPKHRHRSHFRSHDRRKKRKHRSRSPDRGDVIARHRLVLRHHECRRVSTPSGRRALLTRRSWVISSSVWTTQKSVWAKLRLGRIVPSRQGRHHLSNRMVKGRSNRLGNKRFLITGALYQVSSLRDPFFAKIAIEGAHPNVSSKDCLWKFPSFFQIPIRPSRLLQFISLMIKGIPGTPPPPFSRYCSEQKPVSHLNRHGIR